MSVSVDVLDKLLSRHEWSNVQVATGMATAIPAALKQLLRSGSPHETQEAYWEIENHIVVQGQVFEAALPSLEVLLGALALCELPQHVKIAVMEVVYQVVAGYPHQEAADRGNDDIVDKCISLVRKATYLLYREAVFGPIDAVKDVLSVIDEEYKYILS